ncbi:MAG: FAD-binding oxidoreductase [Caulobacterales bacterium]
MPDLADGETDLRSGLSVWEARNPKEADAPPILPLVRTDIAIIGAGITGALLAERMTREGRTVALIDRRVPQQGSTAASTALLQWEIDAPMLELEQRLGFETAARIYRRSQDSVRTIGRLCVAYGLDCDFAPRDAFYLAGNALDPVLLREEARLRLAAGLPSRWISGAELAEEGLIAEAALRSQGAAEVDPVALARGLLDVARQRGAIVLAGIEARDYEITPQGVTIACDSGGVVVAEHLFLANGYEMPEFVRSRGHKITSTWAIATAPRTTWPSRAMVWEAAEPYAYMRTTFDGRIVIGGEDEDITDPETRDAATPGKAAALRAKLAALFPVAEGASADFSWSGFFGETEDSLPLIGAAPGSVRTYAAFGYGGNGITFSAMAADILAAARRGERDADEAFYALDRFE